MSDEGREEQLMAAKISTGTAAAQKRLRPGGCSRRSCEAGCRHVNRSDQSSARL